MDSQLIFLVLCGLVYLATCQECMIPPHERDKCGPPVSSALECVQRGCCWNQCHWCGAGVPDCYLCSDSHLPQCLVTNEEKLDCGHYGIDQISCIRQGCCWAPTDQPNIPWCFSEKAMPTEPPTTTFRPPPTSPPPPEGLSKTHSHQFH